MTVMNKHRLSKILSSCDLSLVKEISDSIESSKSIRMQKSPRTALVMVKARDSVSTQPFYMGEVLVTECTVAVENSFGLGVAIGEQPERAYGMAVIDAACNDGMPVLTTWKQALEDAEARVIKKQKTDHAALSRSKVDFETMGEYDANH